MVEFLGLWLVPAFLGVAWLVAAVLTRGRVPMWVIVIPLVVSVTAFAAGLSWGRSSASGGSAPALDPGFGLMIYALTGILVTGALAILNALALIARWLVDRRR